MNDLLGHITDAALPPSHTQLVINHTHITGSGDALISTQDGLGNALPASGKEQNGTTAALDMLDDISTPSSSEDETSAAMATCGDTLEQLLQKK